MRKFLKALSLVLIVGGVAWAVLAFVAALVIDPPRNAEGLGAMIELVADTMIPTILSGGVLWLLVSIDERLERRPES